jgi:hypothetical protein
MSRELWTITRGNRFTGRHFLQKTSEKLWFSDVMGTEKWLYFFGHCHITENFVSSHACTVVQCNIVWAIAKAYGKRENSTLDRTKITEPINPNLARVIMLSGSVRAKFCWDHMTSGISVGMSLVNRDFLCRLFQHALSPDGASDHHRWWLKRCILM